MTSRSSVVTQRGFLGSKGPFFPLFVLLGHKYKSRPYFPIVHKAVFCEGVFANGDVKDLLNC